MLQLLIGEISWRGEPIDAGGAIGVVVWQIVADRRKLPVHLPHRIRNRLAPQPAVADPGAQLE